MGEFRMPSLGSKMVDARLVKWLVEPGDAVKKGDIIGEIDTEKGLIDVEALEDGIIKELKAREGESIPVGSVMAIIAENGKEDKKPVKQMSVEKEIRPKADKIEKPEKRHVKVSPLARRIAEDLNIDLAGVKGSGSEGTIHRKDVEAYAEKQKAGEADDEELKMAGKISQVRAKAEPHSMRRAIAAAMSQSNREIPHYYLESEIEMKAVLDWLEKTNGSRSIDKRLMPSMLILKAVANALGEIPELNGFWTDDEMHIEEGIHIGFAISLRQGGLVIPAILNADMKSLDEIRQDFVDLVLRAREGHLKSREISSATITVTSLGERGAEKVFGVIYPPQVALLGFGKITDKPRAIDDSVGIRPVVSVVLAGDHRATDGHTGSRFLEILNQNLQHPDAL